MASQTPRSPLSWTISDSRRERLEAHAMRGSQEPRSGGIMLCGVLENQLAMPVYRGSYAVAVHSI
jgi:hypothetical protein